MEFIGFTVFPIILKQLTQQNGGMAFWTVRAQARLEYSLQGWNTDLQAISTPNLHSIYGPISP